MEYLPFSLQLLLDCRQCGAGPYLGPFLAVNFEEGLFFAIEDIHKGVAFYEPHLQYWKLCLISEFLCVYFGALENEELCSLFNEVKDNFLFVQKFGASELLHFG
jgi:hypothetical protein